MKRTAYYASYFLFGLLCLFSDLKAANAAECPDGWAYYEAEETCIFKADNLQKEWNDAKLACENHQDGQANLIKIENAAKQTFVTSLIPTPNSVFYWIGLSDIEQEGSFVWTDGTLLGNSYNNWNTGEPNDSGGEDCAHLRDDFTWNDLPCSYLDDTPIYYLCEMSAQLNDVTTLSLTTEDTPELDISIGCTENVIEVALDIRSMAIASPYVYFDNHSCIGKFNGTHIVLTTGLNQCGTKIKFSSSKEITYYNNVWYMEAESDGAIISRFGEVKVAVECTYSRDKMMSVGSFSPNYNVFNTFVQGFGDITFSMGMYKAGNFTEPYAADDYPIDVDVGRRLYVQVSAYSSSSDLELLIDSCKASASGNPLDTSVFNYPLIEDGCAEDNTVVYIESGSAFSKRFSFEAFVFLNRSSEVFLHCEAVLCNPSDGESCDMDCVDQPGRLSRRSVSRLDKAERNIITIGPLRQTDTRDTAPEEGESVKTKRRLFPAIPEKSTK